MKYVSRMLFRNECALITESNELYFPNTESCLFSVGPVHQTYGHSELPKETQQINVIRSVTMCLSLIGLSGKMTLFKPLTSK